MQVEPRYMLIDRCINCGSEVYLDSELECLHFTCQCGEILLEEGGEMDLSEQESSHSTDSFAV